MELIKVKDLKPHPRNTEFFDDIVGDNWELFLESVRQNGVITPIVISSDLTIISGNQRVRACLELGIEDVLARIKIYKEDNIRNLSIEDVILEELILTNLRQRGIGNPNMIKMSKCAEELNRINQNATRVSKKTHDEVASEMGISRQTFERYLNLSKTIPEIQNLIQDGKISSKIAREIFSKMSDEDQKKVLDIYTPEKLSELKSSQIKEVIKEIEIIKEVYPDDYEELLKIKDKSKVLELRSKDLEKQLHQQTVLVQQMKASNENIAKAEAKRKRIEEEYHNVEKKKIKLEGMYGDKTNSIHKQSKLDTLLEKHKETMSLIEVEFIGFTPHKFAKDHFDNILREYKEVLLRGLNFVDEMYDNMDSMEGEFIQEVKQIERK